MLEAYCSTVQNVFLRSGGETIGRPSSGSVIAVLSLTGLGQVLEFMYTAKLNLSSENVDDVLAVASFLQMQDIITACHALKSFAEPASSPGENTEASALEGKVPGRLFLKGVEELGLLWRPCP